MSQAQRKFEGPRKQAAPSRPSVWSLHLLERDQSESFRVVCPSFADEPVGRKAVEGLEPSGEVVGGDEVVEMPNELAVQLVMKRVTPLFTIEYRQAKRPSTGSAKPDWAHARTAPIALGEKRHPIATSAFKTVAVKPPAEVTAPSIPSGCILPSLVAIGPMTGQASVGGAQSRSYGAPRKQAMPRKHQQTDSGSSSWRARLSKASPQCRECSSA